MLISKSRYLSLFTVFCCSKKYFIIFGKVADQGPHTVICVVIAREILLLQSDCPKITKVHNKFKNNNKNGNFTFKCCWWPVGVCSVLSECLLAKICYSWSSDKFAKRTATCGFFFNSALFLLLVGSGPKWSMPIEKLGSSSLVSSTF